MSTIKVQTYREHPVGIYGRRVYKTLCEDSTADWDSPHFYEAYVLEFLPSEASIAPDIDDPFHLQAAE